MKAHIEPLVGKYYGTSITVLFSDGTDTTLTVWVEGRTLSRREKARGTRRDEVHDSHFESDRSYKIACTIRDALNNSGYDRVRTKRKSKGVKVRK